MDHCFPEELQYVRESWCRPCGTRSEFPLYPALTPYRLPAPSGQLFAVFAPPGCRNLSSHALPLSPCFLDPHYGAAEAAPLKLCRELSGPHTSFVALGDPSLRLKSGSAQDDAADDFTTTPGEVEPFVFYPPLVILHSRLGASSFCRASPGRSARIRDSPTRNASYPAARSRATSSAK